MADIRIVASGLRFPEGPVAMADGSVMPDAISRISGDAALENLVGLQKSVQRAGEDRFAFVEYATEEELAAGDDTEC